MKRIAIQGIKGSFHDIASHRFFENEDVELICCESFEKLFDAMKADHEVIGLAAIENTIAGSLLHNYELLRDSGMTIVGEHKLRISHSIMCLPEDEWDDRFVEACQMHCHIEYMADVLTVGELEQRVAVVDKLMKGGYIDFLKEYTARKKKEVAQHGEEPENA